MGRNSGGSGGGGIYATSTATNIAVTSNGKKLGPSKLKVVLQSAAPLDSLSHRDTVKELHRGISRFEAVMGVRERHIQVADLDGAYGVTYLGRDGSQGIYLSRKAFDKSKSAVGQQYYKDNYATGFKNVTRAPVQHTITHELAHSTWTRFYDTPKHKAAGKEITELYKRWTKDHKKKGYGLYGASNVDEFWAEVITKAVHGKADRYTKRAVNIARRWKL